MMSMVCCVFNCRFFHFCIFLFLILLFFGIRISYMLCVMYCTCAAFVANKLYRNIVKGLLVNGQAIYIGGQKNGMDTV